MSMITRGFISPQLRGCASVFTHHWISVSALSSCMKFFWRRLVSVAVQALIGCSHYSLRGVLTHFMQYIFLTCDDIEPVSESLRLTVATLHYYISHDSEKELHTSQRPRLTCGGFSESSAGYLSSRRTLESCKNRREVDLALLNL